MIEKLPNLTIADPVGRNRPTSDQIAAFADTPTGFVADAMDGVGALDYRIKPVPGTPDRFHGPALTCWVGPADILGLLASLGKAEPGDVIMAATEAWTGCAVLGDRVARMAQIAGATAIVTDGLVRDRAGIREVGLPVFAAGAHPNSPHSHGPGSVGLPILLGGVPVSTGDIVVGDEDGVVVVPFARIGEVIARLEIVRELERKRDDDLSRQRKLPDRIQALIAEAELKGV
ncbi:aldolase [Pseudooceanicola lipolyticus]|uniref:Putative 4-hydroxy-4-methyl-2-oxoglutarate aldolase n=1 Tax=Pseudooceanicola lipolyticus TaxID=2029104 RepID=A0A2M8J5A5_9RHOB|nr:RraA family protein [Pseudooceanicola lipolyticus]PJE37945.1 aldolase [Pseudooceanicola lipolyticus]